MIQFNTDMPLELELPYPPTMNTYWRNLGDRTLISRRGRNYQVDVMAAVLEQQPRLRPFSGLLKVAVRVQAPDRRRRDLDNLLKPLLDALTHAGVWGDDSQIHHIDIRWEGEPAKPGGARVQVVRLA